MYIGTGEGPEIMENFQGSNEVPLYWWIDNPDNDITWSIRSSIVGSNGASTSALAFENVFVPEGRTDYLYTYPIDLTNAPSDAYLTFDLAYSVFPDRQDELIIELSKDCGATFEDTIFQKAGFELQTHLAEGIFYVPQGANQWRLDGASLAEFVGQSNIILRFVNNSRSGNNYFIDNLNIQSFTPSAPSADFIISDERPCKNVGIFVESSSTGDLLNHSWEWDEFSVSVGEVGQGPHSLLYFIEGPKTITLTVENEIGTDVVSKDLEVIFFPENGYDYINQGLNTVAFNAIEPEGPGVSYLWDFGDGNFSTEADPSHTYATDGTYVVQLDVTNKCTTLTSVQSVMVSSSNTDDFSILDFTIFPNPASEIVQLRVNEEFSDLKLELKNSNGQLVKSLEFSGRKNVYEIDLTDVAEGVYIVHLRLDGKSGYKKLTKVK